MSIIHHVEQHLGKIELAWRPDGLCENVSVSRFRSQPIEGMTTYVTLGLSHHTLSMPNEREVRQELVFSAFEYIAGEEIARFLLRIADLIISREEAILRGTVIGPGKRIFSGSPMNAVYVSLPVMFDESLATYEGTSPSTVLVWLIPILADEARYVEEHGWEAFEDLLEQKNPDLWDLRRTSVITSSL